MQGQNSNDKRLYVGIDLGTSRTTIMSRRGAKSMVRSVVGYPRDIIGVKILNNTVVVGQEALDNHTYLNLHFPLADGVLKETSEKDEQAAIELLRHVVSLADAQADEKIYGIIGVPARASVYNKSQLLKISDEVMDMSMVVSEPFMVAYGLEKLNNAIIIDIGAGTIDLCAMKGTVPAPNDQVTLMKGGNYVDEVFCQAIAESYPDVQMTSYLAQKIKEKHGFVGDPTEEVVVNLRSGGKPMLHDVTRELRFACETIIPDILESMESLISGYDPEDQTEALKNVILAGGGCNMIGLDTALAEGLKEYGKVNVSRVADPDFAGSAGALKLASELPTEYWNQVGDIIGG
ncbi:MamK family actin-like protein [Magnetofaba australis]|uniref:MamK n=1 Tax=Magnetofaba australis IT-1 TaxID=1434232 RepID=W0LJ11_9PROT|nr:MamK family actin-like protein [Magnetofaba australis]AHG23888.1 MamK [Magnetofaba australis IT-1]OSM08635.1 putative Magnetosome protein MamK [Magnetofaba australis IT-1]